MKLTIAISKSANETETRTLEPGRYLIGRSPESDLTFSGAGTESVSWNHAEIDVRTDGAFLKDLQSSNGTWLNGRRIPIEMKILDGDEIRLGQAGPALRVEKFGGDGIAVGAAVPNAAAVAKGGNGPLAFGGGTGITSPPFTGPDTRDLPSMPAAVKPVAGVVAKPPVPSAARPVSPPLPNAEGERRSSTTRAMLVRLQKSQRGWRGVGIAAILCVFVALAGYAVFNAMKQKSETDKREAREREIEEKNQKLAQQTDDLQGQAKKLSGETQKLHTAIKNQPKDNIDTRAIGAANRGCVYLVGAVRGTRVIGLGTAFAVNASGLFGTNAHVTELVKEFLGKKIELHVIGEGGKVKYKILSVKTHPGYRAKTPNNTHVPDVGTMQVELPAGTKLKTVTLGDETDLKELGDGSKLCYIGFPSYLKDDFREIGQVKARTNPGSVVRMLTLQGQVGEPKDQFILEHNMMSWGGASGSPIFNARGHVVALHFAANRVENEIPMAFPDPSPTNPKRVKILKVRVLANSPGGTKFGIRVDKLKELLK